jgi:hypothetical protein
LTRQSPLSVAARDRRATGPSRSAFRAIPGLDKAPKNARGRVEYPDAAAIYQTTNVDVAADPVDAANDTGTGVSGPAQNQLNAIYAAGPINTQLRYGHNYEFRVRMQYLSGGAPDIVRRPINETASDLDGGR